MKKIVFVGGHNDDAEIFAWGTLLKYIQNKDKVFVIIFDGWNKTRQEEQTQANKLSKFEVFYFKNEEELKNKLLSIGPDILITHRNKDTHPDHRRVNSMVLEVLKYLRISLKKPNRVFFCNTHNWFWEDWEFTPTTYVDISYFYEQKKQIINCFESEDPVYWNKKAEAITKWYWNRCNKNHVEWFRKFNYLWSIDCDDLLC